MSYDSHYGITKGNECDEINDFGIANEPERLMSVDLNINEYFISISYKKKYINPHLYIIISIDNMMKIFYI